MKKKFSLFKSEDLCNTLFSLIHFMVLIFFACGLCFQGEPRSRLSGAGGFRHLQQSFTLLQRQFEPGAAPDVGGVRCIRHVCTPTGRFLSECQREPASY